MPRQSLTVQPTKAQSLNLGPLQAAMQQAALQRMQMMQLQAAQQNQQATQEQKALAGPNYDLGAVAPGLPTLKGVIGDSGEALNAAKEGRAMKLMESKSIPMSHLFPGQPGQLDSDKVASIWQTERKDLDKMLQEYKGAYDQLASVAKISENLLNNPKAKELFGGLGGGALMQHAPEYAPIREDLDKLKASLTGIVKPQFGSMGAMSEGEWQMLKQAGGKLSFALPWEEFQKRLKDIVSSREKALEGAESLAAPYSVQTQKVAKDFFEKIRGPKSAPKTNALMERLNKLPEDKQARLLELFEKMQEQ